MLNARQAVSDLPTYHPPLGNREGLRLDFNENTVGCSPRVLQRLRELNAAELACYPEREPLEGLVAGHLALAPEQVLLTNGVDEAIHLLCETYLEPSDEVLIVVPTFSMYEIYAQSTGAKVIAVQANPERGFRFPVEVVLSAITGKTRMIALASPNNPTGAVAPRADLLRIADAAPAAAVLVDEAYYDFWGETVLDAVTRFPNLFVTRTFSKAYGLAGLRIGVLAGNTIQMPMLRKVASPYNVNGIGLACLPYAIADREFLANYVRQVLQGRARLMIQLTCQGVPYWIS